MYDVRKIQRGAQRTYSLAPSPSTFYTLARGAIGAVDEMLASFQRLPAATKKEFSEWNHAAIVYRARLQQEQLQATNIVQLINEGDPDWNKALQAGADYAIALKRFFVEGDASRWAHLANQLADIEKVRADETGSDFNKITWLAALWGGPWAGGMMAASETLLEGAGEAITEQVSKTKEAAEDSLGDAADFLKKASGSIATVIALGLGVYFFGPAALAALGLGGRSGE